MSASPTATAALAASAAQSGAWLHLMWLASPALPVGGFSYSEGLEAAVDHGRVHDESTAARWLGNQLELVMARAELPVMAAAHAAALRVDGPRLRALNEWVHQSREAAEALRQTQQMGRSLVAWIEGLAAAPGAACPTLPLLRALEPAPTWPVAWGCAAAWRGAPCAAALQAAAFGWCENMVQAALRCLALGQAGGQRLLAGLVQAIPEVAQAALGSAGMPVDGSANPSAFAPVGTAIEPIAFAPMLAVFGARHETQYSRLFRS